MMSTQQLFEFAAPEPPLVLETIAVAATQWMTGLPSNVQFRRDASWDRFHTASERLASMGVVVSFGDLYFPKQLRRKIKTALRDF